jgi:hypothetical protein
MKVTCMPAPNFSWFARAGSYAQNVYKIYVHFYQFITDIQYMQSRISAIGHYV